MYSPRLELLLNLWRSTGLRSALHGQSSALGSGLGGACAEHALADAHSFEGLRRSVGTVAWLHVWLSAVLEARGLAARAQRSLTVERRHALLATLAAVGGGEGTTAQPDGVQSTADAHLREPKASPTDPSEPTATPAVTVRRRLVELDGELLADASGLESLRRVVQAQPLLREALLAGRQAVGSWSLHESGRSLLGRAALAEAVRLDSQG
eukprot:COSAG04_NODE_2508_length_3992_cov_22.061649_3_plen_210_part_00